MAIDYEKLRQHSAKLISELKGDPKNKENQDSLLSIWSDAANTICKKESDVYLHDNVRNNSEETTLSLILSHLLRNRENRIVQSFIDEYKGRHLQHIIKYVNNYKKYTKYTAMMQEKIYKFIEEYCALDNTLSYFYWLYQLVTKGSVEGVKKLRQINKCDASVATYYRKYLAGVILANNQSHVYELEMMVQKHFKKVYCKHKRIVVEDHLPTLLAHGQHAFTVLSDVKTVYNVGELALPVRVDIYKQQHFHSLIVCPVTKLVCTKENMPMLLECSHVISASAVDMLSDSGSSETFKCPYCPVISKYDKLLVLQLQ